MHVIKAENIRDAYYYAMERVRCYGVEENSRLGKVLVIQEPVTIHYRNPKQHVLLDKNRDANPFFHLMEAMWMLDGREDSAFLDHYVKDFGARFAVDGIVPDAYGYRWRYALGFDQLDVIVNQLRETPNTRQAILQMWGAGRIDLCAPVSKPCNLVACFMIRQGKLDMTVFNRSNDLVWGCCGSNAVHFPILQEYIATRVGVEMGTYEQVTNNLHLYTELHGHLFERMNEMFNGHLVKYQKTQPLMLNPDHFDDDLQTVMNYIDYLHGDSMEEIYIGNISNPFLTDVVVPMVSAYKYYKMKDIDMALLKMEKVTAEDWKLAGRLWLERRHGN